MPQLQEVYTPSDAKEYAPIAEKQGVQEAIRTAKDWIGNKLGSLATRTALTLSLAAGLGVIGGTISEMADQTPHSAAAAARPCGYELVRPQEWLGGQGVSVRSNAGSSESCKPGGFVYNIAANPPQYGLGWQCLELAARLYKTNGWYEKIIAGGNGAAKNIYAKAERGDYRDLVARANGSGYKPVPGDIIVHSNGTYGHVTIVDRYEGSVLYALEQNASDTGKTTYGYDQSSGGVSKPGINILGYVHATKNTLTNPGSGPANVQTVSGNGKADFDGDSKSDFVVRSGDTWTVRSGGGNGIVEGLHLGDPTAKPLVGDINGDGISDFVTYKDGSWTAWHGTWPNMPVSQGVKLGDANSTPFIGDVNGDRHDDFITFKGGLWEAKSSDGVPITLGAHLGPTNAIPLVGDIDGDGRDDFIAYDRGTWAAWRATGDNTPIMQGVQHGNASSKPIVGDVDRDGRGDLIIREGNTWYIRSRSSVPIAEGMSRGSSSSTPFISDINGDGRGDLVTFESTSGAWFAWNATGANDPVSQGVKFGAGGTGLTG